MPLHTLRSIASPRLGRPAILALAAAGLCSLAGLAGCSEADASAARIKLHGDGSGELLASSVTVRAADDGPVQKVASPGITWAGSGSVIVARGTFADINKVSIAGITFEAGLHGGGKMITITVPRGPEVTWPDAFTVRDPEARKRAAKAISPDSKNPTIGDNVKIVVEVPGTVVSAGAVRKARGVGSSFEETLATLTIPVDVAVTKGEPIVWHVTWTEPTVPAR